MTWVVNGKTVSKEEEFEYLLGDEDYIKDFNFDYKIIGKINKKQLMKIQKT